MDLNNLTTYLGRVTYLIKGETMESWYPVKVKSYYNKEEVSRVLKTRCEIDYNVQYVRVEIYEEGEYYKKVCTEYEYIQPDVIGSVQEFEYIVRVVVENINFYEEFRVLSEHSLRDIQIAVKNMYKDKIAELGGEYPLYDVTTKDEYFRILSDVYENIEFKDIFKPNKGVE